METLDYIWIDMYPRQFEAVGHRRCNQTLVTFVDTLMKYTNRTCPGRLNAGQAALALQPIGLYIVCPQPSRHGLFRPRKCYLRSGEPNSPERGVVLLEVVRTNNRAGLECMVRSVPL